MVRIPLAVIRTVSAVILQWLATFICGGYIIVLLKVRPESRQVHWVLRFWAKLFLLVTWTRVTVEGGDRIDPNGSYIFVGNHSSNLDIPVIMGKLPVPIRFLAKKEIFKVPVLGGAMRAIHMIETDRGLGPTVHRAINKRVTAAVAAGLSLMIFPEGTRSENGKLLPFKKGAFRIAVGNTMPIVPVTIVGTREAWRPHAKLIFGGRARLIIHDPIPTDALTAADLNYLRDRTRDIIDAAR